jgi:hypothetical protein
VLYSVGTITCHRQYDDSTMQVVRSLAGMPSLRYCICAPTDVQYLQYGDMILTGDVAIGAQLAMPTL